jgi:hypothetical protein
VLHDCTVLDNITGEEMTKTIHLEVIYCDPIIVSTIAADEDEHVNYVPFIPSRPPGTINSNIHKIEYWQLVCSNASGSQAMSLI